MKQIDTYIRWTSFIRFCCEDKCDLMTEKKKRRRKENEKKKRRKLI